MGEEWTLKENYGAATEKVNGCGKSKITDAEGDELVTAEGPDGAQSVICPPSLPWL